MSEFTSFPFEAHHLERHDVFVEAIEKATWRYQKRMGLRFEMATDDSLTLAHSRWVEIASLPSPQVNEEYEKLYELLGSTEFEFFGQHKLITSMEKLCSIMCAVTVAAKVDLSADAEEHQKITYERVHKYPSEYFSLLFTCECY